MPRYLWNEEDKKLVLIDEIAHVESDIWFPKGGTKYFDKALQKEFSSKSEKRTYMKEHHLAEAGDMDGKRDYNVPEAGLGKKYYSYSGQKECSKGYKYR